MPPTGATRFGPRSTRPPPGELIVDCRSATYVAAWRPARDDTATRVQVAVVEEVDGARRVVSHMAKKTRGEVARHLLVTGARPRTAADLERAVTERFVCELAPPERAGAPFLLTVVQPPAFLATTAIRALP